MAQSNRPLPPPAESAPVLPETKRSLIRVWFADGTFKIINPNRPRLLLVFELEFSRPAPDSARENLWIVWHALGRPGDFEDWIDTVDEFEWIQVERGKAFPSEG